jgi:hypothetical protein
LPITFAYYIAYYNPYLIAYYTASVLTSKRLILTSIVRSTNLRLVPHLDAQHKDITMIDVLAEEIWTLDQAAEFLHASRSKVYAWTIHGCRGVTLESIQLGTRRHTSREAVGRFVATLSVPAKVRELRTKTGGFIRSQRKRKVEAQKSGERLKKAGA